MNNWNVSAFTQGNDLPWNAQTLFCCQGTTDIFYLSRAKAEVLPESLHKWVNER